MCSLNTFYSVSSRRHGYSSSRLTAFELQESTHPFVQAMVDFLLESGKRANRLPIVQSMMRGVNAKYEEDMKTMNELVEERQCISERLRPSQRHVLSARVVFSDRGPQEEPDG